MPPHVRCRILGRRGLAGTHPRRLARRASLACLTGRADAARVCTRSAGIMATRCTTRSSPRPLWAMAISRSARKVGSVARRACARGWSACAAHAVRALRPWKFTRCARDGLAAMAVSGGRLWACFHIFISVVLLGELLVTVDTLRTERTEELRRVRQVWPLRSIAMPRWRDAALA